MLGELDHAREQFLRGVGNGSRVLRLRVLLPAQADRAQDGDERDGRGDKDAFALRPHHQVVIAFERGAEEGFRREEQHHVIERVRKLAGIITVGQRLDRRLEFGRMLREGGGAFHLVGRVDGAEEVELGHLGIDDDDPVARQAHHEVGLAVALLGLLGEVAVRAHPGRFDHAAQGLLAPTPPCLVGAENFPQLKGLGGKRLALRRQRLELLLHFSERGGLRVLGLLEALLIGGEVLLQRLDQRGDGLLALLQVALGGLLEFAKTLFGETQKLGGRLLECIGT